MRAGTTRKPATKAPPKPALCPRSAPARTLQDQANDVLAWLERTGSKAGRDGMARYAIPSDKAFGVPVGVLQAAGQAPWQKP